MKRIQDIPAFWRRRSLKFWLATGMLMSLAPIYLSAVTGYLLYRGTIIQPLLEVASAQRNILHPLQSVQLSLWDVSESVVDFVTDGEPRLRTAYQEEASQINASLENLATAMDGQGFNVANLDEARNQWQELSSLSGTILAGEGLHGNATVSAQVHEFESLIDRLAHQLETIRDAVSIRSDRAHEQVLSRLALLEYLALGGLVVSIIGAVMGVVLINRSLVNSMNQLVDGSMRFSSGDREHQIEVQIPCELVNVANAFNQMTQRIREQENSLRSMAITDGLTGLYNRREFDRLLADEVKRSERSGGSFSLIIGDIDHFKTFNDRYGHQTGDEVLCAVGQALADNLREVDKACRFGGEEFVVILPDCNAEAARQAAERARDAIASKVFQLDGKLTARVTMSFGVATSPGNGNTPEALLKRADMALYQAKGHGRNRVMTAV
ncbi:MAG: diguanylate cyclase [Onishia taeanensis]|uniref:diguanylate cyclase n=1 Tax=Onishia taeanensis TaxID=284577 RepID=UPI003C7B284B